MIRQISLAAQLIIVIAFVLIAGPFLPLSAVKASYTFSLLFKELLSLFLPFMVFSFVFAGIVSFKKKAPLVLSVLISAITISNGITALLVYGIFTLFRNILCDTSCQFSAFAPSSLDPYFSIHLYNPIGSEKALLLAVICGIILTFFEMPRIERLLLDLKEFVQRILLTIFIPLLPLYVLGFLLKIRHEGVFAQLFIHYGKAFIFIIIVQWLWIGFMYLLSQGFSLRKTVTAIKNAAPSYLTAFSTMSSTATIPVTLQGVEKNIGHGPLGPLAVPIMANVHLLGDAISTPLLSLVTLQLFLGITPTLAHYLVFVGYFCITMLAASGVPGGGIIVMIPVLKSMLGFTPEMISVITTLYLLQDPIGTAGNVMGDGALVIMVHKLLKRLKIIA